MPSVAMDLARTQAIRHSPGRYEKKEKPEGFSQFQQDSRGYSVPVRAIDSSSNVPCVLQDTQVAPKAAPLK